MEDLENLDEFFKRLKLDEKDTLKEVEPFDEHDRERFVDIYKEIDQLADDIQKGDSYEIFPEVFDKHCKILENVVAYMNNETRNDALFHIILKEIQNFLKYAKEHKNNWSIYDRILGLRRAFSMLVMYSDDPSDLFEYFRFLYCR